MTRSSGKRWLRTLALFLLLLAAARFTDCSAVPRTGRGSSR